jgi:predicted ABC-type ATPase
MKKAIIITGNVASGKTTLAKEWVKGNPEYEHLCMDDIRMRIAERNGFPAFSYQMENEAKEVIADLLQLHQHVVFETTGFGKFNEKMITLIENTFENVYRFHINVDLKEVQIRLMDRNRISGYVPHPEDRDIVQYSETVNHYYRFLNEKGRIIQGNLPPWCMALIIADKVDE